VEIVAGIIGACAGIAWLVAVVSWIMALNHRADEVTLGSLLINGIKAFDPASFDEKGRVHQKRFVRAFGAFFLFLFLAVGVGVLSSAG
jgi:hypothetical protein